MERKMIEMRKVVEIDYDSGFTDLIEKLIAIRDKSKYPIRLDIEYGSDDIIDLSPKYVIVTQRPETNKQQASRLRREAREAAKMLSRQEVIKRQELMELKRLSEKYA